MNVTFIQTSLFWENREKNLLHIDQHISKMKEQTDLIILPEMFTTGFSMNAQKIAEEEGNREALDWMKSVAHDLKCVVAGSIAVEDNGKYFNRLFWVKPDKNYFIYDKRHLFRMAKEENVYSAGNKKIFPQIDGWNFCPMICYDLRFPVWSRNKFNKTTSRWEYDVLIYVANWPQARSYAWKQLLVARAIENQCYVIGVNRIGNDGNGHAHAGDSVVVDPKGDIISKTKPNEEKVETVNLDKNALEEFRKSFPVGMDADDFYLMQ